MEKITTIKSKFLRNIFDQNTYILTKGNEVVIVDAGAELEDVISEVQNKKVLAVFLTHIHFDHVWNLEKYVEKFDCDVYVVEGAEEKFLDAEKNASTIMRLNLVFNIAQNKIKYYAKKLKVGKFDFEVFETPGHSSDCVCILWKNNLFVGDTIFADGVGRTDLYDSNNSKMVDSLNMIKQIDFETAYPGHYGFANKAKINQVINYYL